MLMFAATLIDGFGAVLTPQNLLLAAAGVTLGTLVGVLPGIGPALTIALLLGCVGIDTLTGQSRLTFGVDQLGNGIDIVIVAVGLFAVGEALHMAAKLRKGGGDEELLDPDQAAAELDDPQHTRPSRWLGRSDVKRSWKPWLRGAAIGFPFGALPAGGAELPTFLSYSVEKRLTKRPEEFSKGAIEGVAGPEAANNASFSGTLVPLLTLGLPTSATAAIMLAAFQIFNLQPGPQLFTENSALVWTLIASLYVGNVMLLLLNLPMIKIWVKVLEIPREALYSGILVFATLGVYSLSGSTVEVLVMYVIGVAGFFMRRYEFPIAPVILGVILGPVMEVQFRRALVASGGDARVFVDRPLTVGLLAAALFALVLPYAPAIAGRL